MGFNANGKERASHHHFVHVEGEWHFTTRISDFLKKRQSDKLVQSVAPQCAPCALGVAASEDMKRFPVSAGGMRYEIRFWESKRKPPTLYKADTDLQIRKTYCVQAHFVGGPQTRAVRWYNRFFSDLPPKNDATFGLSVKRVAIPSAERDWRRGYYANPRWMRSFPEQGQRDSLIERHQALQDYEQDLGSLSATTPSMLERKLARYQRHLASRKRMQQNKRRTLVSTAAADSSTSSSSDSTSNSD